MSKKISLKNLYIFTFILWFSTEILFNTTLKTIFDVEINKVNNVVNWLIFALLMLQIVFFQTYNKREVIIIVGITLPIVIATILSGSKQILSAWMFIVAAKNNKYDKIINTAYKILLIMLPMIIFLQFFGIIEDRTMMRGNIQRYSLGFSHPNQLGLRIVQLILCHCYVNRGKLNFRRFLYIILAVIFTIEIPNSQTAYISLMVFLILLFIYKYIENQKQMYMDLYMKSLMVGVLLLNLLSILFSYIDVNKYVILSQLNNWMSARFSWCHKVWQIHGVSFWGQKVYVFADEVKSVGMSGRLWLDNSYASILLRYGILVFLIFSISYLYLLKNMAVRKEYVLVIILFLYSLYGIMENGLYMVTQNIFLIAFSDLLFRKTDMRGLKE